MCKCRETTWVNGGFTIGVNASLPGTMLIPSKGNTITISGSTYKRTSDRLLLQPLDGDLRLSYNTSPTATHGMELAQGEPHTHSTTNHVIAVGKSATTRVYVCFEGYLVSEGGS